MHALELRFVRTLDAMDAARAGDTVLVAVSGGIDSVALLRLFCSLRTQRGLRLCAAHCEHGLRGDTSRADAAFVEALCARLEVPCAVMHADVSAEAARRKTGLEDAARAVRYAFLEGERERTGARWVALGHQMEDQAETLLLHMARGCGLAGLVGMRPVQGYLLRPLLDVHRAELADYLAALEQPWREDETNASDRYTRNRVRQQVLPALACVNPRAAEALAGLAARAAQDEDCLQAALTALPMPRVRPMPYGFCVRIAALADAHAALRMRGLRVLLDACACAQTEASHLAALDAVLTGAPGQSCNLPGGWRALRGRAHVHLLRPGGGARAETLARAVPLCLAGETLLPDGARMQARPALPDELGDGVHTQVLDARALQGAVVRTRLPGDRFQPLGAPGTQPFRQTLMDRGVDRPFRPLLPLVAHGSRVLWAVGLLPAQDAARRQESAALAIHLTYCGTLPWEEQDTPHDPTT